MNGWKCSWENNTPWRTWLCNRLVEAWTYRNWKFSMKRLRMAPIGQSIARRLTEKKFLRFACCCSCRVSKKKIPKIPKKNLLLQTIRPPTICHGDTGHRRSTTGHKTSCGCLLSLPEGSPVSVSPKKLLFSPSCQRSSIFFLFFLFSCLSFEMASLF